MNRQENRQHNRTEQKLSILVDKKRGTYYCIDTNGKSYIRTDGKTFKGENRR